MDYRSYFLDFECGVFVYNMKMIEDVIADFDNTFKESQLIDMDEIQKVSFFRRLVRAVLRLFAPLM
jgi:cardiolipin synthase